MATRLLSHLAHVELITPKLDASVKFFNEVLGMTDLLMEPPDWKPVHWVAPAAQGAFPDADLEAANPWAKQSGRK